jgi:TIR domain/Sulfatase-modifying factor enzyme 1/Domain of unknown function (DUF4062)
MWRQLCACEPRLNARDRTDRPLQDRRDDARSRRVLPTWRVFLSHTSEFRQYPESGSYVHHAERAVSAAGHVMQYFAADQAPADVCEAAVKACDVYVGIFGARYGSPVRDRPEVSYTELEFETASEEGIPRLVFVLDDSSDEHRLPPKALVDLEYGKRQKAFVAKVQNSGLTVQRFRNPEHLQLLVERSLRQLAERSAPSADRVESKVLPRPLPGDLGAERSVFISYSHADQKWLDRLEEMLVPLVRGGLDIWSDKQIEAGDDWRKEIEDQLSKATVAVLLVSPEFIASDFIHKKELPPLLEAARQKGLRVLWVPISDSLYERTPIGSYQAAHPPKSPLSGIKGRANQDKALKAIAFEIERAIQEHPSLELNESFKPQDYGHNDPALTVERILRWRARSRVWRESLAKDVDLPLALIPSANTANAGEFLLGVEPVTLMQWQTVAGWPQQVRSLNLNPTEHNHPDQPVTGIDQEEALEFCRRLAVHSGRYYELPSEGQWEHACRAGSPSCYSWGDAWSGYLATSTANSWGLRGMHGSVWQWCRGGLLCGGSWNDLPERCQASSRATAKDPLHPSSVGLRVCCLPFGTPYFQLEASKSQWRPIITRAACAQVLARPLNESEFTQLEQALQRFRILGILQLRLFLALLADRLGAGADDPEQPLSLESDRDRISLQLPSIINDVFTMAAFAWRERGWHRLADQAVAPRQVMAELGLAIGQRQQDFLQSSNRAAAAFPEPL